jgi:Benzoate membrane transport protein
MCAIAGWRRIADDCRITASRICGSQRTIVDLMTLQQSAAASACAFWRDLSATHVGNGIVAFLFAATGPLAVVLTTGTKGGLTEAELASWVFGAFFLNGVLSIVYCFVYRQPLVFFWTIPGTVLVGPALTHLTFAEVIGAFLATGVLMIALGLTGLVRRAMEAIPMPIVMGMVAGVFLSFGLDWVRALESGVWIAAPMTVAFLLVSLSPARSRSGCRVLSRRGSTPPPSSPHPSYVSRSSRGPPCWSSSFLSPSPCWSCRTARASPFSPRRDMRRPSTPSPLPVASAP